MKKLTKKEQWFLNWMMELRKADDIFWSPTNIGQSYNREHGNKIGYGSDIASPILLKLTKEGIIERNNKGHYRYIEQ